MENNLPTLEEQVAEFQSTYEHKLLNDHGSVFSGAASNWLKQQLIIAEQRGMHRVAADIPRKEELPGYFDTTV